MPPNSSTERRSETDTCRESLSRWCGGSGLDIGFGGAKPIVPWAICLDREPGHPDRAHFRDEYPTHLIWDAFTRLPFETGALNFVYSSHCLEDAEDTKVVLWEWLRILKPGGYLVLFCPDQQTYQAHCVANGTEPNQAHKWAFFGLQFVKDFLPRHNRVVYEQDAPTPTNPYSFELVVEKLLP